MSAPHTTPTNPVPRWKHRLAAALATLVELGAVCSLALLLAPRHMHWLLGPVPVIYTVLFLPFVDSSVVIALALALFGIALRRRKRAAWLLMLIFQGCGAILALLYLGILVAQGNEVYHVIGIADPGAVTYLGPAVAVGMLAVFGVLLILGSAFPARLAKGAILRSLAVLVGGLVAVTLVGWGLVELFPGDLGGTYERLAWAADQAAGRILLLHPVGITGHAPMWVSFVIGLGGAVALCAAVVVFFASARSRRLATAADELRVRRLLAEHGEQDSLGYFATRRDKSVMFAPSHKAAVTYRVLSGCSLASGDPIGDPGAWQAAVEAWLAEARRYGWIPCVLGASERGARVYTRAGLKARELGDEAVLETTEFRLSGRSRKSLRQAVTRLRRAGYTARIRRHADIPAAEFDELLERAEAWRGAETERGFSMALGRLGDPTDGRSVMAEAFDADGRLRGLLSFVPWGRHGLSLDVMRRDATGPNGINEFLVTELVDVAEQFGVRRISLNFAMFRAVFAAGERIGAGPVLRAWRAVLRWFSRFFQLESLYRSSAKYAPEWVPRFLCYPNARQLPRVSLVAGMAEGFVPSRTRDRSAPSDRLDEAFLAQVAAIDAAETAPTTARRRPEQVRVRLAKLATLEHHGMEPYPPARREPTPLAEIRHRFPDLGPDEVGDEVVTATGRVTAVRDFGGVCFVVLRDDTDRLQVLAAAETIGECALWLLRRSVDIGDRIGVSGPVGTSRTGELSVHAQQWWMEAKCLHPLPNPRKPTTGGRARHLELLPGTAAGALVRQRGQVLRVVRETLQRQGFLEVETPVLQPIHGGANARPFVTHLNAYDRRMYLRIAPELYLKRLCVAGVSKVFELGRNFRNEGADASHNPEFTMLEAYRAHADYHGMAELATALVRAAACAMHGAPVAVHQGAEVDLSGEWPRVRVYDAISAALGVPVCPDADPAWLREVCVAAGIAPLADAGTAELVLHAYEKLVEPTTYTPTFYTDFPAEVSVLTRPHRADSRLAERWDLVAFGREIGTGYTELTDPGLQRDRLAAQSLRAAGGDPEAMELDEEFLRALEYGMPPTGGLGLGIDRLVMMLTGAPMRQVVTFPFTRTG